MKVIKNAFVVMPKSKNIPLLKLALLHKKLANTHIFVDFSSAPGLLQLNKSLTLER